MPCRLSFFVEEEISYEEEFGYRSKWGDSSFYDRNSTKEVPGIKN